MAYILRNFPRGNAGGLVPKTAISRAAHGQYEQNLESLFAELGKTPTQLTWFKNLTSSLNNPQHPALIGWGGDRALFVQDQAAWLSVNRSGLYYHPVDLSLADGQITNGTDAIYAELLVYRLRRLTAPFQSDGLSPQHQRSQG